MSVAKTNTTWVFGSSSPLAQTLIERLSSESTVWCFGRTPPTSNAKFIELDLSRSDIVDLVVRSAFAEQPPQGVVFCQRYRPATDDSEIEIIKQGIVVELGPLFCLLRILEGITGPSPLRSIVVLSSVAGKESHPDIPISYHILKAATLAACRSLTPSLAPQNIRINCIVLGEFLKAPRHLYPDYKQRQFLEIEKFSLDKRICSVENISRTINFLLGEDASFITGQELILDGGISLIGTESLIRAGLDQI